MLNRGSYAVSSQNYKILETPQGNALQLRVPHFLQHILPPLQHGLDVDRVLDTLLHFGSKSHKAITARGRWKGFPDDPAGMKGPEKKVFRHFPAVVESILGAGEFPRAKMTFSHNPKSVVTQEARQSDSLPDGYLSTNSPQGWKDVLVFGEFKTKDSAEDVLDNIRKVTSSMAKCMHGDPRRRFIFAFTVENAHMRLWFCDRSQILVSDSFNFITDHIPMIHFFLSLAHADPADIGLDPTMTPLNDGRYDITVRSDDHRLSTYRTVDALFLGTPEVLCCGGTRVWKARRVAEGREVGEPVALKDAWVSSSRRPEAVVLEDVRQIELPAGLRSEAEVDAAFLTVECHGDVHLATNGEDVLDCTRSYLQGESIYDKPIRSRTALANEIRTEATSSSAGIPSRLVHHRIVFKEICKTLEEETSLTTILRALARIALVLQAMHSDGWIHRDISSRNIFIRDDGVALLGDLEYTKKVGKEDEIRVGTPDFVSAEVEAQDYNFTLFPGGCIPPAVLKTYPEKCEAAKDKMPARGESRKKYPFLYNPLHDLESLWWIAVYFLVNKEVVLSSTPGGPMAPDESPTEFGIANFAHGVFATELFLNRNGRRNCLSLPNRFMDRFSEAGFHECLYPFAYQLNGLRQELVLRYYAEELDIESIGSSAATGLHQIFHDALQVLADLEGYDELIVRRITYISPENYLARMKAFASPSPPPSDKQVNKRGSPSSSEWSSEDGSVSESSSKRRRISTFEDDLPVLPQRPEISKRRRPYLPRRAKTGARIKY